MPNFLRIKGNAFTRFLLLYSDCCIHTKVKYCQCILFCHEITSFIAPEIPHPLIFVQNRSHQRVNMSDLLSEFHITGHCRITQLIKSVSGIIIKHNGVGWSRIWHPKLENIKIVQLWLYPNNDGRRIFFFFFFFFFFFWFNAASIMGVYLENEYFTLY